MLFTERALLWIVYEMELFLTKFYVRASYGNLTLNVTVFGGRGFEEVIKIK